MATKAPAAPYAPYERLIANFLMGRGRNTTDSYIRDLDDFVTYLQPHAGLIPTPLSRQTKATRADAVRWLFEQLPGRANETVLHYRHHLFARNLSTATAARRISVIKSLAKYARMSGLITWAIEVQAPKIERTRDTRGPTVETIQAMLTTAAQQPSPTGPRDVALIRLAYDLGLRISELSRLDVADIELKTGGIWIFGKGRRAKELLTMPAPSRDAIRLWLEVRGMKPGPLFLSYSPATRNSRLVTRGVYRIIRDLGAANGVQVRPHGLRHTAITQAIDAAAKHGLSIDIVRQFSRHRSLTTLMVYRDIHENKQATLAEWVSDSLGSTEAIARSAGSG